MTAGDTSAMTKPSRKPHLTSKSNSATAKPMMVHASVNAGIQLSRPMRAAFALSFTRSSPNPARSMMMVSAMPLSRAAVALHVAPLGKRLVCMGGRYAEGKGGEGVHSERVKE